MQLTSKQNCCVISAANAGGRGEAGAMYDQGDQEDKDIAAEQDRAAQLREELPEEDEIDATPPSTSTANSLEGTFFIVTDFFQNFHFCLDTKHFWAHKWLTCVRADFLFVAIIVMTIEHHEK